MPFEKGREKTGGRIKGKPSKLGAFTKEECAKVFEALGGTVGFIQWARENPDGFYLGFMARSMPKEVEVSANVRHEIDVDDAVRTYESALVAVVRARGVEEEDTRLIEGELVRSTS